MQHFKYDRKSLSYDMLKATLGLLIILPVIFMMDISMIFELILAGIVLLFTLYAARTCLRYNTVYSLAEDAILVTNSLLSKQPKRYEFSGIEKIKLRYYSTRRTNDNGWMDLKIKHEKGSLHIDTNLYEFSDFVQILVDRSGYTDFDSASESNLTAIGVVVPIEERNSNATSV